VILESYRSAFLLYAFQSHSEIESFGWSMKHMSTVGDAFVFRGISSHALLGTVSLDFHTVQMYIRLININLMH